ncbi:MAG: hypothetical protein GF418_16345 [Chitinivibrionales bacterium]|nr:hypothetical protein [Chitinivibrionales bacterium]MBD3397192.1 hypothetical protein [Chitinivibrionales bacterium]
MAKTGMAASMRVRAGRGPVTQAGHVLALILGAWLASCQPSSYSKEASRARDEARASDPAKASLLDAKAQALQDLDEAPPVEEQSDFEKRELERTRKDRQEKSTVR